MAERRKSKPSTGDPSPASPTGAAKKTASSKYHPPTEFGGVPGTIMGFIGLPVTVYYLWICLEFYDGSFQYPRGFSDIQPFFQRMLHHAFVDAAPTIKGATIYLSWFFLQATLAWLGPGPQGEGVLLKDGKTHLKYTFNGSFAWGFTLSLAAVLHYFDIFRVSALYDNFGAIMTTASLWATLLSFYCYCYAFYYRVEERISGNFIYDYFMGTALNPRIGSFDIKFFCEIRPGIMLWFFLTLSIAVKQFETHGLVTTPVVLLVFYHFCYANACYKGEECIPMSMDIIYEKFGWMLCWADLVWVPFTYCLPAYYLIKVAPFEPPVSWSAFVLVLHLVGYYIFDTSNSQKDSFRGARHSDMKWYRTFPWLPWGRLTNPKYLQTKRGTKLLLSGWWGLARHMNYTGDLMMAWAWGLTAGFGSFIPYFYAVYMTTLLLHREGRDNHDCKNKYGADWDEYCKRVPYRLIPYIY